MKTLNKENLSFELERISFEKFGYSVFKRSRKREEFIKPRQSCMYALKTHVDLNNIDAKFPLRVVGEICSNKNEKKYNHSTVLSSNRVIQNELDLYNKGYGIYFETFQLVEFWRKEINKILHNDDELFVLKQSIIELIEGCQDMERLEEIKQTVKN